MPMLLNKPRKDFSGTCGTATKVALPIDNGRVVLELQNISANTLGFTTDGTPAAIGTPGTFQLAPGQGYNPAVPPTGEINVVGSASGTVYTLKAA